MIQYGPTAEIFRAPVNLESARVFSDPPINVAEIQKQQDRIILNDAVSWTAPAHMKDRPDGPYTIALRAYQLLLAGDGVRIQAQVQATEISGSETTIRMLFNEHTWVSESHGIHHYAAGQQSDFYFDPDRCMYFDADENLITAQP